MGCVIAAGLAAIVPGCATEAPAESEVSSEVSLGWNWIQTPTVAVRSCDNAGACDTGQRWTCGGQVQVDYVDFSTGMARLPPTPYVWVIASALSASVPDCVYHGVAAPQAAQ